MSYSLKLVLLQCRPLQGSSPVGDGVPGYSSGEGRRGEERGGEERRGEERRGEERRGEERRGEERRGEERRGEERGGRGEKDERKREMEKGKGGEERDKGGKGGSRKRGKERMRKDPKKGGKYIIIQLHMYMSHTHTSSVSATEAQCSPSIICTPTITTVTLREKGKSLHTSHLEHNAEVPEVLPDGWCEAGRGGRRQN